MFPGPVTSLFYFNAELNMFYGVLDFHFMIIVTKRICNTYLMCSKKNIRNSQIYLQFWLFYVLSFSANESHFEFVTNLTLQANF